MGYFRKKPVVIEAYRWQGNASDDMPRWLAQRIGTGECEIDAIGFALMVNTLEGRVRADVGDWIIRGVKGEVYPCKPDVFEATYEAVIDWHRVEIVPNALLDAAKHDSYRKHLTRTMTLYLTDQGCDPSSVKFTERPHRQGLPGFTEFEAVGFAKVTLDV